MAKTHFNDNEKPACSLLPGYYEPLKLTKVVIDVTCARCKRMRVYKRKATSAVKSA